MKRTLMAAVLAAGGLFGLHSSANAADSATSTPDASYAQAASRFGMTGAELRDAMTSAVNDPQSQVAQYYRGGYSRPYSRGYYGGYRNYNNYGYRSNYGYGGYGYRGYGYGGYGSGIRIGGRGAGVYVNPFRW